MKHVDEGRHPADRVRSRTVWITSGANGTEHAVSDEQMTAALIGQTGIYVTRCGERCIAASLMAPALRRCADCLLLLRPGRHRAEPPRGGPLLRWMYRLFKVPRTPVAVSPHPEGGGISAMRPDGSHGGDGEEDTPLQPALAVAHHRAERSS